jgi:drug/metabolite transporter (DMT)-like permease
LVAVLLALAASASWGVSDFLAGVTTRRLTLATVMGVTTPLGILLVGAIVLIRWDAPPDTTYVLWGVATGVLAAAGIAALYQGLTLGRMGVVAPIAATAPVIPVAYGLARGDRPSTVQGVGMALAVVGIVFTGREHDVGSARRVAAGAGFAVFSAATFGIAFITLDQASNADPYWATLVVRVTSSLVVVGVLLLTGSRIHAPRSMWPAMAVIATLDVGGVMLFAISTTKGLISVVSVLVSLVPVFVAVLARTVLHERLGRIQIGGAATAIVGAALISAG